MMEKFMGQEPRVDPAAWVHPTAVLMGRVSVGPSVSVWPGAVLRGDVDAIEVGEGTNIQDQAVLHANSGKPVVVGPGVTVGHGAVVHGSRIGAHCLIGMGAVVMDSEVGEFTLIGAGSVVTPGSKIPAGSLVVGMPGKVARRLSEEEKQGLLSSEKDYIALAAGYGK